jgi:serine protease Do
MDGREAYAAARALASLAPGSGFLALKQTLEAGEGLLVSGLSPDQAAEASEILARHGAEGKLAPHAETAPLAETTPARDLRPMMLPLGVGVAVVVLAWWLWPGPRAVGRAGPISTRTPTGAGTVDAPLSARDLGALAAASTATLRCADSLGSGFFVAPEQLVTNAHVLCPGSTAIEVVMSDGRKLAGVSQRSDRWLDLGLVRVAGANEQWLALDDASTLRQGDQLFFFGSPRGLDFTLSRAMVSHQSRFIGGIAYVQLDGNVNPGNSGGPLLSPAGKVVGIVTAMIGESSGLGLALPVNYLYDGDAPFLPSPRGADHVAWKRLLGKASADDAREAEEARISLALPALAGAQVSSDGAVLAVVARGGSVEPLGEHLNFRVERDGNLACMPTGEAKSWRSAGRSEAAFDDRTDEWLDRHHMNTEVWITIVPLEWSQCPAPESAVGSVLVLLGGAPSADRATIGAQQLLGFAPR